MTDEELKQKCKERAKIFQQSMESCHSLSPIDCIEWFADRIAELEKACDETQELLDKQIEATYKLDKKNAELKDDNKVMADNYSKMEQKFYSNLTKAKEIIKILLKYDRGQFFDDRRIYEQYMHTRDEAEQFLREVENV